MYRYPVMEQHTGTPLTLRGSPDIAVSAKELESGNGKDLNRSQTYPKPKNQKESLPPSSQTMNLGTNLLDPYLQLLNKLIESNEKLIQEVAHERPTVPHLQSLKRKSVRFQRQMIRLARQVGKLYGSQGWDLKYVHAANTELGRKLESRGGYEALRKAQIARDNAQ